MKKLTMVFAVAALVVSTSAFANTGDKVSKAVQAAFQKNFSGAVNVNWETTDDFSFASFELNGKTVDAAYNEKGELVGVSRKLQFAELPIAVSQALKSDYADYNIASPVTEVVYEGKTFYYATAIGATKVLKLKCYADGQIYVEKRTKK